MAITVKLVNKEGSLEVIQDTVRQKDIHVGHGRVHASSRIGYVTMTLNITDRRQINDDAFIVIRVPVNWIEELEKLDG